MPAAAATALSAPQASHQRAPRIRKPRIKGGISSDVSHSERFHDIYFYYVRQLIYDASKVAAVPLARVRRLLKDEVSAIKPEALQLTGTATVRLQ
eukprot:SAG11_NODE_1225_length_5476_cov_7.465129_4_plen_95_part_00